MPIRSINTKTGKWWYNEATSYTDTEIAKLSGGFWTEVAAGSQNICTDTNLSSAIDYDLSAIVGANEALVMLLIAVSGGSDRNIYFEGNEGADYIAVNDAVKFDVYGSGTEYKQLVYAVTKSDGHLAIGCTTNDDVTVDILAYKVL